MEFYVIDNPIYVWMYMLWNWEFTMLVLHGQSSHFNQVVPPLDQPNQSSIGIELQYPSHWTQIKLLDGILRDR